MRRAASDGTECCQAQNMNISTISCKFFVNFLLTIPAQNPKNRSLSQLPLPRKGPGLGGFLQNVTYCENRPELPQILLAAHPTGPQVLLARMRIFNRSWLKPTNRALPHTLTRYSGHPC